MSQPNIAFIRFLSPIQLLFQLSCWAPPLRQSDTLFHSIYSNIFCFFLTALHFLFSLVTLLKFEILQIPDDFTNQTVVTLIELTFTVVMIESFCKQENYRRVVQHFEDFDRILISSDTKINMLVVYNRWKKVYYQKIFSNCVIYVACYECGSLIYFRSFITRLYGMLICTGKLGTYTKTAQIAFYMNMVRERLKLIDQLLERKEAKLVNSLYGLLWQICAELNDSLGWSLIALYLQTVVDMVNVSHIMYWNVAMQDYTNVTTVGVVAFFITVLMPVWQLVDSCEQCRQQVAFYFA